jgi:drug/metabolite transporter (DMT)-like permease
MSLSGTPGSTATSLSWPGPLDWRVALALAATYASFGSGPAGAKAALDTLPPLVLVGFRGVVAGAILVAWSLASGARRPTRRQWLVSCGIGVLILALGAGGGTIGQQTVPSGVAGVMSALLPIFAAGLGYLLFRERPPGRALIGLAVGVAGLGLLLRPGSNLDLVGVSLIVAGQLSWALGAELAPRVGLPEDPRLAAGAELLGGGAVLLAAAAVIGDFGRLDPGEVSALSWLGLGWLTVTAVVGFTAYGFLARTVAPSVATTFSYVNPLVAMGLGWLLFGEPLTVRMMLATAVVVVGVCLIVSAKSEAPVRLRHPLTSGHGHRVPAARKV